jgi:hypothetical protein
MILSYHDTHSNVRYGDKPDSFFNRILCKLESVENEGAVLNGDSFEDCIYNYYDNGKLTREECNELLSIAGYLAGEKQTIKRNGKACEESLQR